MQDLAVFLVYVAYRYHLWSWYR